MNAVVFAAAAEDQLDHLYRFISGETGEGRADSYVGEIIARCRSLRMFPLRGTKRDDIRRGLRTMGHARRVTIAFSVDEMRHVVNILGIFYGGQDVDLLLKEDEPRIDE